jgi:hypothetical protein
MSELVAEVESMKVDEKVSLEKNVEGEDDDNEDEDDDDDEEDGGEDGEKKKKKKKKKKKSKKKKTGPRVGQPCQPQVHRLLNGIACLVANVIYLNEVFSVLTYFFALY